MAGGERLSRWIRLGQSRWPGVEISEEQLSRHLERLGVSAEADHPHAEDLYLACACCERVPSALEAFHRELMPEVRAAARRIDASPDFADELTQAATLRLLFGSSDGEPRLATYAGTGPLRAWIRIAAMRMAMNAIRDGRRYLLVEDEAFLDLPDGSALSPGDRKTRSRYAEVCAEALRAALASLSPRERTLLRMHHLHGLTIDDLAPKYNVHRASIARWIARARDRLLAHTRAEVRAKLELTESDADSILRALYSRIDLTLSRLLAE